MALYIDGSASALRITTGSAGDVELSYSIVTRVTATGVDTASGSVPTNITTATGPNAVISGVAGSVVTVKEFEAFNNHATVSNLVTLDINDGTDTAGKWKGTLLPGEFVIYDETGLWTLYGVDGVIKPAAAKLNVTQYVTADSVHATAATFAGVTGLSVEVKNAKVYIFEAHLYHIANATTSGAQFALGGVACTFITVGSMSVVTAGVATTTMSSGVATAVDTAAIVQTTSSTAANVPTIVSGSFQPSADGTMLFKATSEVTVAAGLTVRKGSWWSVRETAN